MANEFDSKIVINTSEASRGITNLDKQAQALDRTLAALDKTVRSSDKGLANVARSLTAIVAAQRTATQTAGREADAELKLARAKAATAAARDKNASAALKEARTQQAQATATARNSTGFQDLSRNTGEYARNAREASSATLEIHDSLSNTRYLLYDIGATYRAISIGLLAIPAATATVAAAYERDFAQVLRTTGGITPATIELRSELKQLATEIPMAFSELANIASIGGQLNVPIDQMAMFTDVVARFAASTNVSIEDAAIAFGRLRDAFPKESDGNPEYFNQIGSAITELGDRSVATETEIIAIINQLAPLGSLAGFSSAEIAGLSSALASVRIRPELARGSFQRIFFDMSAAADQGGQKLDTFARYVGVTAEEAKRLIQNDPSVFFTQFIGGVRGAIDEGASFNSVLADIGLKGVRDRQFLLALANGYDTLSASMKLADDSYNKATYLRESSEPVFNTLIANLQKMANSFQNLADSLGSGALPLLSSIVKIVTDVTSAIGNLADSSPAFRTVLQGAMSLMLIVGVMAAIKAAMAFGLAAIVGFQQVAGKAAIGTSLSFRGMAAQAMVAYRMTRGESAATAAQVVKDFGVMGAAAQTFGFRAEGGTKAAGGLKAGLAGLGSAALGLVGGPIGALILGVGLLATSFIGAQAQAEASGKAIADAMAQSAEAGEAAIAAALNEASLGIKHANLLRMDDLGKSAREIGEEAGIGFDQLITAVQGGDKALEAFNDRLESMQENGSIAAGDAAFLRDTVTSLAGEAESATSDIQATDAAIEKLGGSTAPNAAAGMEEFEDAVKLVQEEVDKLFASVFNIVNNEAALNAALQKFGESLAGSGSFSTGDEGGRENLANFQAVLEARAKMYQEMVAQGQITAQQAATDFEGYIASLMTQVNNMGGDTAAIQGYADEIKAGLNYALAAGVPPTVPVAADVSPAQVELDAIKAQYGTIDSTVLVQELGAQDVANRVDYLTSFIAGEVSGPFVAPVEANTENANTNVSNTVSWMSMLFGVPFVASVDADTSFASQAIQFFASWAQGALASIGNAVIHVRNMIDRATGGAGDIPTISIAAPVEAAPQRNVVSRPMPTRQAAPAQAAPAAAAPVIPQGNVPTNLAPLADGYKKAGDEAAKAGEKGKKAAKDMADSAKTAAEEVADYAQRLGKALKDAYNQQYGVQEATDAYYSQLNAIKKQREDEINQVRDLTLRIKELRNARGEDLVTARKAQIEADISAKYGEFDRAADYSQQAQTARDAAAEKQVNIDTAIKEQNTLRAGIGALTGYSEAAIRNREALRNLESKMLDMITAYAATGKSQNQISAYANTLTSRFKTQVSQLGFNVKAFSGAQTAASRYGSVIRSVPTRINTSASNNFGGSGSGAIGQANALRNALNGIPTFKRTTHETVRTYKGGVVQRPGSKLSNYEPTYYNPETGRSFFNRGGQVKAFNKGGLIPGQSPADPREDNLLATVDGKGMVEVRSGEYILRQEATDYYGLAFMDKLNRMQLPRYNDGGSLGRTAPSTTSRSEGPLLVELTAENITAILRAADRPINLYADAEQLATTVNNGNDVLATKGV